jgi:16S rRNA (adenine1518-N6/adenine1519-N6)-dimethyltransferase
MAIRYLDRPLLRQLARECELLPRPPGQSFLHEAGVVRRIATALGACPDEHVLHVGAGMGALTLALLDLGVSATAVEIDEALARQLPRTVAAHADKEFRRLVVHRADALALTALNVSQRPTSLLVTLPHTVAVDALLHLLVEFPSLQRGIVVTELSAADRLGSVPRQMKYGPSSLKASYFGVVQHLGSVTPSAFWPRPRPSFGVLRIQRHAPTCWLVNAAPRAAIFEMIDMAFRNPRLTMRSALSPWAGSGNESARRLLAASINPSLRPVDLEISDFVRLHERWMEERRSPTAVRCASGSSAVPE